MICDECFEPIEKSYDSNNQNICDNCLHKRQPRKVMTVQKAKPTLENLKKIWEKKY